ATGKRVGTAGAESADDPGKHTARGERLALTERQLINVAEYHAMRDIEIRRTPPGTEIPDVLHSTGAEALQGFGNIVDVPRVGVGQTHGQSFGEAPLEREVDPFIRAVSQRIGELQVPELRVRRQPVERLVGVIDGIDVRGLAAYVVRLHKQAG